MGYLSILLVTIRAMPSQGIEKTMRAEIQARLREIEVEEGIITAR